MIDPEIEIDESILLGAMVKNHDIYKAVSEIDLDDWFFESQENARLNADFKQLVHFRCHSEAKSVLMAKTQGELGNFERILTIYNDVYDRMFAEDDFLFINIVKSKKKERLRVKITEITARMNQQLANGQLDEAVIDEIRALNRKSTANDLMTASEVLHAIDNSPVEEKFMTGIETIDNDLTIFSSSLLILAGESSTGKTTLVNQFVFNFLHNTNLACMYFSLETNQVRLGNRFIDHISYISKKDRDGARRDFEALGDRLVISKLNSSLKGITRLIRDQYKKDDRLKFIVVDYLQIVEVDGLEDENKAVAKTAVKLHFLAQELGLVVILLCQLRKEEDAKLVKGVMKRPAPTMNSLRGSQAVSNAADYVGILQFSDLESLDKRAPRATKLHVVKQKEGPQFVAPLIFFGSKRTFKADII